MPSAESCKRDSRISRRLFDDLTDRHRRDRKYLIGRLLTVIDGVIADPVQRKAVKDLVEDIVFFSSTKEEDRIREYSGYLAKALKEKCDWIIEVSHDTEFNPLTM